MVDEIDVLESDEDQANVPCSHTYRREPIVIRGVGQLTVFGLSSRFDPEFPPSLTGWLLPTSVIKWSID